MYCTPFAPAIPVFASQGSISTVVAAPELNNALQSLAAQPPEAAGRLDKLTHLQKVLQSHADQIGPASDHYCQQLAAEDPVEVSEALQRLAFDSKALGVLRDAAGFRLPAELVMDVPALDAATRQQLDAGLARATRPDQPERLLNKEWFRLATNLGSGLFYMMPALLEWAAQAVQAKAELNSNALSRMMASAARMVEQGATAVQGYMGEDELIAAAKQGPIGLDQIETFLKRRSFPIHLGPALQHMSNEPHDVLALIQQAMSGTKEEAGRSSMAAVRAAYHFGLHGHMVTRAMRDTKDPALYARLVQVLSLQSLQQLNLSLTVLNGERIGAPEQALAAGQMVFLVCNHRSHLDTLVLLLLFEALRLGFVAKKSLLQVPILGELIRIGGHLPIDTAAGHKAIQAVTDYALQMHQQSRAIAIFPEQTRHPTLRSDVEAGLQPFKIGAFRAAQQAAKMGIEVLIQPVFIYGDGLSLPKGQVEGVRGENASLLSAFMSGIRVRQPTVVDVLEPIRVNEISQEVGTGLELAKRLSSLTQYKMWQTGARLQATMNRRGEDAAA